MIGIDVEAEPVIALGFDLAAAIRLNQEEIEWNRQLFGGDNKTPASPSSQKVITEYW